MVFKLPERYLKKKQEEYELKYIKLGDKQIHISELEDRSVTPELKSKMRMNSWAQDDLPPKLNDEALVKTARSFMSQCLVPSKFPCSTYEEALIHRILPELVKRLEEKL